LIKNTKFRVKVSGGRKMHVTRMEAAHNFYKRTLRSFIQTDKIGPIAQNQTERFSYLSLRFCAIGPILAVSCKRGAKGKC